MEAAFALLLTVALGAVLGFVGHALVRGRSPEAQALAALLGTVVVTLIFGTASHLGLSARPAALLTAAVLALPVTWACQRLRWPRRGLPWLALAMAAWLACWPLALGRGFSPFNDTLTYVWTSEWLQEHAFAEPCPVDPRSPLSFWVADYQSYGLRMGASFLLALVRAVIGLDSLLLFVPVMAWGMVLNGCAAFLLARWALGLSRRSAAAAVWLIAAGVGPMSFATLYGFLPQLYGTACLVACCALLARQVRSCGRQREQIATGCLLAGVASFYSELLPIAVVACLAALIVAWWSSPDHWRTVFAFAGIAVVALVVGHVEWWRAGRALVVQAGSQVGWPLEWSLSRFVGFALGAVSFQRPTPLVSRVLVPMAIAAFLLGLTALRRRSAAPLLGGLAGLAGLTILFAFVKHDPFTGRIGHTWALFKLAQWALPLLVVVQAAGLALVLRRWSRPTAVFLALVSVPVVIHEAGQVMTQVHAVTGSKRPLADWLDLRQRVAALKPSSACVVHGVDPSPASAFAAYLLAPVPCVNGWSGTFLDRTGEQERFTQLESDALVVMWGTPPWGACGERWPGGLTRLPTDRPTVFQQVGLNQVAVWSPRAGRVRTVPHSMIGEWDVPAGESLLLLPAGSVLEFVD